MIETILLGMFLNVIPFGKKVPYENPKEKIIYFEEAILTKEINLKDDLKELQKRYLSKNNKTYN